MRLVWDEAERVGSWVAKEIGLRGFVPPYTALGWENAAGELTGGVVFSGYTGPNVEASVAWRGVLARSVLRVVREHVFIQNACRRMTIYLKSERTKVIRQAQRLGFEVEGFHPAFYEDADGVSLGILSQNCRW